MMSRRSMLGGGCCCAALALAGCVTDAPGPVPPGFRPSNATDEGGLWHMLDQHEAKLKQSRHRLADPALETYVRDLTCRLAGDRCPDVRVYLTHTPMFNASMAPNGMMQVWSGMLLRTRNEAQLAAVLGHELGHYVHRHTLLNHRNRVNSANFAIFLSLGLAVAGAPAGAGDLAQLMALAGVFAFSREQEREADLFGLRLMADAGYPPVEAAGVWEQMLAEQAADPDQDDRSILFATHPAPEERAATLRAEAGRLARPGQDGGAARYRHHLRGLWHTLLEDELRLRRFRRSLVVFEQLQAELPADADLKFAYGELYRLRDEDGDSGRARDAYLESLALPDAPAEAWRGLGLTLRKQGEAAQAEAAFRRYLDLARDAPDRLLIKSYLPAGV